MKWDGGLKTKSTCILLSTIIATRVALSANLRLPMCRSLTCTRPCTSSHPTSIQSTSLCEQSVNTSSRGCLIATRYWCHGMIRDTRAPNIWATHGGGLVHHYCVVHVIHLLLPMKQISMGWIVTRLMDFDESTISKSDATLELWKCVAKTRHSPIVGH
jgi:hypothetical protein